MARLSRDFYAGETLSVAQSLLGMYLVHREPDALLVGRITEAEAYIGRGDKACHAYRGKTERTAVMFGEPGHAYIYLIYGMYHCLNLVTEPTGSAAAVLLRSVEVVSGLDTVCQRRFKKPASLLSSYQRKNLTNGPGKLCQAFGLTRADNGLDLTGDTLFVCKSLSDVGLPPLPSRTEQLRSGPRIGVDYAEEAKDFPWRFWLESSGSH